MDMKLILTELWLFQYSHLGQLFQFSHFGQLLCPRHKMAEGHIEFTLCVCVCVCVSQVRVRPITSLCMVGFKNNLAQMIIKTRRGVACKNHVARLKVKVTVGT